MTTVVDRVRGHGAATLYEAAVATDPRRVFAVDPTLRAAWPGARVAGPAFTVQGAGGDNLALHHAVYAAPAGSVLVVDCNGAQFGHWGEILSVAAQAQHLAGLVIDGGVRDTAEVEQLGFPVFSRNNSVRGTRKLFRGALGVEVEVGGVSVRAGDLVVGDAGVVVLPVDLVPVIVTAADERVRNEEQVIRRLRAGETTLDLYGFLDDDGDSDD